MGVEFKGKLSLTGVLTTCSGLCIGRNSVGSNNTSLPRSIVRHPISGMPFIPASAFRGAIRRLLEKKHGSQQNPIGAIFGVASSKAGSALPARVTFRDLLLVEDSRQELAAINHDAYFSEIRSYASMDRVTSQGSAYAIEEVPTGAQFRFEILYAVYEAEDVARFAVLLDGLLDLESASLGAHGSRGLGKIKFGAWPLDKNNCLLPEMAQGIAITWKPKAWYETGSGESCLVKTEEKLTVADVIADYEKRVVSALS